MNRIVRNEIDATMVQIVTQRGQVRSDIDWKIVGKGNDKIFKQRGLTSAESRRQIGKKTKAASLEIGGVLDGRGRRHEKLDGICRAAEDEASSESGRR
jgi:hypothetical protein